MLTTTVLGAVDTALQQMYNSLKSMRDRLSTAVDFDMGEYPVIPAQVVDPTIGTVNYMLLSKTVVKWPALEYSGWKNAWLVFTKLTGWFGPKAAFPLGAYTADTYIAWALPKLNTAIEPVEDLIFEIESNPTLREQIGLTAAPTPPTPKPKPKPDTEPEPKNKPLLSKWQIVGLVAAAAVGGGIIYYYHTTSDQEADQEAEEEEEAAPPVLPPARSAARRPALRREAGIGSHRALYRRS